MKSGVLDSDVGSRCSVCEAETTAGPTGPAGAKYVRCLECRSVQRGDPVSSELIDRWYDATYRPDGRRYIRPLRAVRRLLWRSIARHLDALAPPGTIIDVGAGEGDLAQALLERQRECVALDPYSRTPQVRREYLRDLEPLDGLSCVVYWHSFEHVADPAAEIIAIARHVPAGGMVVVARPNPCSIQATLFGGRWFGLDNGRHLHIASEEGLLTALATVGFHRADQVWRGSDGGQAFMGWLDGLLKALGWRSGVLGLGLTHNQLGSLSRCVGLCLAAGLAPAAALLSLFEVAIGKPGTVVLIARAGQSRTFTRHSVNARIIDTIDEAIQN